MVKTNTKKICIVVTSLGGGGAERSSATLSEILFDLGYDVHIVSVLDDIQYPYKGKLLNLGELKAKNDSSLGRLQRLGVFKGYLKKHGFDYVIDNRTRIGFWKELIISRWAYKTKKIIYCVRSYNTDLYINPNKYLGKILYRSAYKIVTVSLAIKEKLEKDYNFNNLSTIYNPIDLKPDETKSENFSGKYILFFGRLDDSVKNISLLLEAYSESNLPDLNIKLKILGDGEDKDMLIEKTESLKLEEKVEFLGFQPNPNSIIKPSLFTVLTSRYEGFPRALIESLALEVPVISVDCKSGPNEIVVDEQNGLLVENYNVEALAKALNKMVQDEELYLHCKSNSKASVEKFSKEDIGMQWRTILK
ncbi:glycosyltransferase [Winogradskyella algicola]|uniref:glycosyltransferase n=1 Tax=Winogradskyella algicola TaxID=2575815 RepID=UPI001107EF35|nr:glycosyltransferase [Winogradskyella algicola]